MNRVDRWLFGPVDARAAAVFRVGLSVMLALCFWRPVIHPWTVVTRLPGALTLYHQLFFTTAYHVATLAVLLLFAAGWRSRPMGALLAVMLAPSVPGSGTSVSRQVLLFTLVAFSLLRSDAQYGIRPTGGAVGPLWPIRLIQLQLGVLYGINALAKTTPAYLRGDVLTALSERLPNFLVRFTGGVVTLGPVHSERRADDVIVCGRRRSPGRAAMNATPRVVAAIRAERDGASVF